LVPTDVDGNLVGGLQAVTTAMMDAENLAGTAPLRRSPVAGRGRSDAGSTDAGRSHPGGA